MFGFLNIDKPPGISSYDVIRRLKGLLPRGHKIGHAGTLDPFATGVLVVALGPACRLMDYVQAGSKEYLATFILGAASDTDDSTGAIAPSEAAAPVCEAEVKAALARFVGTIQQRPPAHSAVHVAGRRAYELAREGAAPELAAKPVTIHELQVLRYAWPELDVRVVCGSGTYIRSIARDLGEVLGIGGYCSRLRRTCVGAFGIEDARPLDAVQPERDIIGPLAALDGLPRVSAGAAAMAALTAGRPFAAPSVAAVGGDVAIVGESGELLAIGCREGDVVKPTRVFIAAG